MALTGTVKKFMEDKGFGFIAPNDGGEDIFIHIKQCHGAERLSEGDKVTFDKVWKDLGGFRSPGTNCSVVGYVGAPRQPVEPPPAHLRAQSFMTADLMMQAITEDDMGLPELRNLRHRLGVYIDARTSSAPPTPT
jgi:CspA family cold shock protein